MTPAVNTCAVTLLTRAARAGPVPDASERHVARPVLMLSCKYILAYDGAMGDVYKALADPTRRTILDELTEHNGQTLFEICASLATKHRLASTRQAISQHLTVLEAAGLIETRREGRYKFHDINTEPLAHIMARWLRPHPPEAT